MFDRRIFEAKTDGRTTWIHDADGVCIGRFAVIMGQPMIDVHASFVQMELGAHCLDCCHGAEAGETTEDAWARFKHSMQEHHRVLIPDYLMATGKRWSTEIVTELTIETSDA